MLGGLEDVRGDLAAVVVEGRVDPGHVPGGGVHGAEGDGGALGEVLVRYAEVQRGPLGGGGRHVHDHLREDGVDRAVHGLLDGDRAVAPVVLVLRGEGGVAADDGPLAGAVVDGVEPDQVAVLGLRLVLQGRCEHQRLEGGGRLVVLAGGVADVVLDVVLAAVQRDDLAGLRVDGGRAGLDGGVDLAALPVQLGLQLLLHRLLQLLLALLVDGEGERPAAGLTVLGGDALLVELLVDRLDEIAGLALHALGGLGLLRLGELLLRALGLAEPAHLDHVLQRVGPAVLDQALAGGSGGGPVVLAGGLEERGEVGALGDVQVLGVDAVVRLGGRLDAAGAASVVGGVDVPGEDLALGLVLVDLERDHQLLELAGDRRVLRQVVVLHVLLGDGRATLLALAAERVEQRAGRALEVDAVVLVEGLVLRGDEGVLHLLGHLGQVDDLPVDAAVGPGEHGAVAVLVDVALPLGQLVGGGDVDVQVERAEGAHAQQDDPEERTQQLLPREESAYAAALRSPARPSRLGSSRIRSTHCCVAPASLLDRLARFTRFRSDLPANTVGRDERQAIRSFPDVTISTRSLGNRLPRGAQGCENR
ncbi:protein of unknown function [Streptomyces sp. KY75]|nr:protein of unknown function [Streptomyces sp. KY70]CAD5984362.1 protein of unknown function [Streptomyces sp. KY75]